MGVLGIPGLLSTGKKVRAYRGGSPRIWTEEGEMSTVGGKLGSDEAGAFLSSNPRTASTYAKTGKEGSQVAPVDLDTSDFITIDPPKGQTDARWNNLSPESVITFTDGKKMTIAEALPDYKYMGKQLDTNLVATLLRTHPMVKGKGVAFNNIQDRGPQVWGATAEEIKDFGAKAFEPQTSYAVWDESAMKGAFAKNEGPGFMNGLVLPAVAGGTVTMMTAGGDDAEAAPLPVTIGRLVQLGFLTAEKVANPSAVKTATTKYNKAMKADRRFAANERMAQENEYQTFLQKYELDAPRQELDLVDLEGKPIMGILSDRSMKGEVTQVGGIPLETPTQVEGGMMFPRAHQDMDAGWMSMYSTAKPVQKKIQQIAEDTGESPIILPMAMGEKATDFSTPIADMMFKQARANPPKKAAIKQFDAEMRKKYDGKQKVKDGKKQFNKDGTPKMNPYWVGLEHPGAYDQLMGLGEFPMEGAGKMRTAFSTIMGKADYRNQGFPSYDEAIRAANDPAFEGMPIGTMGFTSFKGMPEVDAYRQLGLHGSYDTVIPGQYSGATELPFFAREIFGDAYKHLDVEMTKPQSGAAPRLLNENEKIKAIATRGARPKDPDAPITSYEVMTPQRIDEVGAAMERKKELAKKYGTYGAALLGLGGTGSVMAEPAATFDTQQPPQDDFDRLVGMVTKRTPQPQPVMPERDPLDVSMAGIQRKQNASFGGLAKDTAGAFGTGFAKGAVDTATNLPRDVGGLIGMMPFMDSQKSQVVGGLLNSMNAPIREKMVVPDYEPSYMMSDEERDKVQKFGELIPGLLF